MHPPLTLRSTQSGSNEVPAKLLLDDAEEVCIYVNGHKHAILPETINRSSILQDICSNSSKQQEAELPLSQHAMVNWLEYIQNATACDRTAVKPQQIQYYCLILLVRQYSYWRYDYKASHQLLDYHVEISYTGATVVQSSLGSQLTPLPPYNPVA